MPITNTRTKKILASKYSLCDSLWSQARGLMFSGRKCLLFKFSEDKRVSLHMFFVFFPIDVLYLDKGMRIVEIKLGFRPFSYYAPKRAARYIIEIPSEPKIDVKLGDLITVE